jgi:hypothetical protein
MIEIAIYNCKDNTEARIKEQYHYDLLKATLNSCPPFVDKSTLLCNTCKIQCNSQKEYEKHINCDLHQKKIQFNENNFSPNYPKYGCDICNIRTNNKKDYGKHILSAKHIKLTNVNKELTEFPQKANEIANFKCKNCNKNYKSRVGLWKHKQQCIAIENNEDKSDEIQELKEFMKYLMQENSELKTMMMKVIENAPSNNTNHSHNTTTNSHNKSFNLQFFLNETCKDAMNIMDFVDSIQLQLSDLEKVGEIGYVEGISKIITSNLKALDVEKRPIHCTDKKREVLYIKDENKWEKEDEDKKKLRKAIKRVAGKNQRLLPKFKEAHPDCIKAASKFSDQYNKMIIESMGGSGDNDLEKEDKIIRNITKATTISKNDDI